MASSMELGPETIIVVKSDSAVPDSDIKAMPAGVGVVWVGVSGCEQVWACVWVGSVAQGPSSLPSLEITELSLPFNGMYQVGRECHENQSALVREDK